MSITDVAIGAGLALGLAYFMKREDDVSSAVDEVVEGEVIASSPSEEEIIVSGIGGPASIYIQDPETGEILAYTKVGTVLVEETEEEAVATPDESTAMSGTYFGGAQTVMGRSATPYTAKEPYRRGRKLRTAFKPIGRKMPEVDACERAGRALRRWYLAKRDGRVEPANRKPTARVSKQAAILASTPCEVYKKVGAGEMTVEGGIARLQSYYEDKHNSTVSRAVRSQER